MSPQTKMNEDFTVKAEGVGKGTMTVVTVYHAKVPDKDDKCDNFELSVDVEEVDTGESPAVPSLSSLCHPPAPPRVPCVSPCHL